MAGEAPLDARALAEITAADIVVVRGTYDHVELVLDVLDLPHTGLQPTEVGRDGRARQPVPDRRHGRRRRSAVVAGGLELPDPRAGPNAGAGLDPKLGAGGEKRGEPAVAVTFRHGAGEVFHMISHYYLQRTETRTARHAAVANVFAASKGVADGPDLTGLNVSEVESAATSARILSNLIAAKKRRHTGGGR